MPSNKQEFDYTISFWFRSRLSLEELERDYGDKKAYLFQIKDGPSCFIKNARRLHCDPIKVKFLEDNPDEFEIIDKIEFDLTELRDFQ